MRELEVIYQLYEDEFNPVEVGENVKLDAKLEDRLFEMFRSQPAKRIREIEQQEIKQGDLYLMFINNVPVYYVVYEQFGELYEVIKASKWVLLAAQNDFLVKVDGEWFAIETWNRFYLTESEIREHSKIGEISQSDFDILEEILEKDIEVPESRRGLEVDLLDETYYQTKFHRKEAEIVFNYKARLFTHILAED